MLSIRIKKRVVDGGGGHRFHFSLRVAHLHQAQNRLHSGKTSLLEGDTAYKEELRRVRLL